MTAATARSTGPVPRHALRRGTRGFAAFVLFLTGLAVLAVSFYVLPSTAIDGPTLTVLVPLAIAFGLAHLVAVYGVIRRRAWVVPLTLYLLAIGFGVGTFLALLLRAGIDPLLPAGAVASDGSAAGAFGLLVWLAASWLVAARFVVRGMAAPEGRESTEVAAAPGAVAPQPTARPARIGHGAFTFGASSS